LDGGAHIGAFSEWAKENGAASILAVEPEPSNAALYRENHPDLELIEAAITDGEDVTLVVAPNTWRHAVEDVTHYAGGERISVSSTGLDELLATGVDYVKLDIEGAEMKLLSAPRDWKNVERLVVEWSFTKDRALAPFLEALGYLQAAGFSCAYDGRGTWDQGEVWPGRTDALVFCARDL
jgi:FkbM family methyltransferase